MHNAHLSNLRAYIQPSREKLLAHPVYAGITDLEGLKKFTQTHVFAVWDFMSLLKSLQISLTSVSIPWYPVGSANTRFLINEIVLGEESDLDQEGRRTSHFELYRDAMHQLGADTKGIDALLASLQKGQPVQETIEAAELPLNIKKFLSYTFQVAMEAPVHVKAAVFNFGREDLIPSMFMKLLEQLYSEAPDKVSIFKYYIERHIEVDGGHHGHLALEMVAELCGNDEVKWQEASEAAKTALDMRYLLWDSIMN